MTFSDCDPRVLPLLRANCCDFSRRTGGPDLKVIKFDFASEQELGNGKIQQIHTNPSAFSAYRPLQAFSKVLNISRKLQLEECLSTTNTWYSDIFCPFLFYIFYFSRTQRIWSLQTGRSTFCWPPTFCTNITWCPSSFAARRC